MNMRYILECGELQKEREEYEIRNAETLESSEQAYAFLTIATQLLSKAGAAATEEAATGGAAGGNNVETEVPEN